jgi:hypothetical protein
MLLQQFITISPLTHIITRACHDIYSQKLEPQTAINQLALSCQTLKYLDDLQAHHKNVIYHHYIYTMVETCVT